MTAPIYGPWQTHNATPSSTCPPDAVGKRGQVQLADQTRVEAERYTSRPLGSLRWDRLGSGDVAVYRILIEPVRGELHHPIHEGGYRIQGHIGPTHTLRIPTSDGRITPGEYIGPDGATIVVGVV